MNQRRVLKQKSYKLYAPKNIGIALLSKLPKRYSHIQYWNYPVWSFDKQQN